MMQEAGSYANLLESVNIARATMEHDGSTQITGKGPTGYTPHIHQQQPSTRSHQYYTGLIESLIRTSGKLLQKVGWQLQNSIKACLLLGHRDAAAA
jgi:hypothetical protein